MTTPIVICRFCCGLTCYETTKSNWYQSTTCWNWRFKHYKIQTSVQ